MSSVPIGIRRKQRLRTRSLILLSAFLASGVVLPIFSATANAQKSEIASPPVVVQPGAPGQATRVLPSSTRAKLPPLSAKDIEFMQGMIMHHGQAVEMTALINDRTTNKELRLLGARISHSQAEEMKYMERWLKVRGEPTAMPMPPMQHTPGMDMSKHQHQMLMPGMLTQEQMDALKKEQAGEFDRLFLKGMIQHHKGALVMVDALFNTAGSGQDSQLFNFATDVDSGQRAEIRIMEKMLGESP